ncbi:hypothetical protein HAX54_045607 [Datura stramonium]|uniref:Uncharacterized protein n=1 Tax=Datura stramonium TaxID=4076 RepID=A0ABS8WKT3_DATST|nr:hypothetical protein [Datura stramonium]
MGGGHSLPQLEQQRFLFPEDKATVGFSRGEKIGRVVPKRLEKVLLKLPGLLVLEEELLARNEQSLVWKALNKVETEKRILLCRNSFQNNVKKLYNTLCVVSPKFLRDSSLRKK